MKTSPAPSAALKAFAALVLSLLAAHTLCAGNNLPPPTMKTEPNYTISFTVEQTPEQVFAAINNVRGWWSGEIVGITDRLGAEFTYRVPNVHYTKQRITTLVPGRKVMWHVVEADLTFVKDTGEWKGTDIVFEIAKQGQKTELRFTHRGLMQSNECYDKCSNAWDALVNGNLRNLILTGKTQPSPW